MTAAAHRLARPPIGDAPPLPVCFLTGASYWDLTAFCLVSLALATNRQLTPTILDDGSLTLDAVNTLRRLFPATIFDSATSIEERLDNHLPKDKFPILRTHRQTFPLLRKITDCFAGQVDWRLLLDSDLLFFNQPDELLAWINRPSRPLHGRDRHNAYGYPLEVLNTIAGQTVPECVNTGTLGLNGSEMNWELLERSCATLLNEHGHHYFMEQALVAILLAGRKCDVPPPDRYIIRPEPPEALACEAVMHHYTSSSKRWYFQNNWKRFTVNSETQPSIK